MGAPDGCFQREKPIDIQSRRDILEGRSEVLQRKSTPEYPIRHPHGDSIAVVVRKGRGCSSVVEHLPFKQGVEGSIPSTLTSFPRPASRKHPPEHYGWILMRQAITSAMISTARFQILDATAIPAETAPI
jgi:hypothetical protein